MEVFMSDGKFHQSYCTKRPRHARGYNGLGDGPLYVVALTASSPSFRLPSLPFLTSPNPFPRGTVIQGFVPAGRVGTFDLSAGFVYKLTKFFGSRSKIQYRVADHSATVSFSWNSSLSVLENHPILFPVDRFRFHSYDEFKANCDSKGGLYDYVGHMKLVNGQTITDHIVLDEADITEKRHLCVHVQSLEPVMKLYLWD
ncbi:hypothetical protein DY000_02012863 [Brassica cretica]|uniref:Uncharacterized protein n=1 Tax=Brassica cretica TaxID=69181 RepID=A0ABQ7D203_BRACR|nr:hypothetical protein DY000_02012863 [Brassica cretica]